MAAFIVNQNVLSRLYILDMDTDKYQVIKSLPIGQISSLNFNAAGDELGMVINATDTPGDIYTLNIDSEEIKRWTYSEVGGLNTSKFPKPELITYETYDKVNGKTRMIPAFVYKPEGEAKKPTSNDFNSWWTGGSACSSVFLFL
mgnify:CR=1 FL=1